MSTIYWRGRVKIITGEMSLTNALISAREAVEEGRTRLSFDTTRPGTDQQVEQQAQTLFSALLIKYATRAVETRDNAEGSWTPLKLGESRPLEVTEGEVITLSFTTDLDAILAMLTALPVTLARAWTGQVWMDNEEVASQGFLAWLSTENPPPSSGDSPSAPSTSKRRRRNSPETKTSGDETPTSTPLPSDDSSPSFEA